MTTENAAQYRFVVSRPDSAEGPRFFDESRDEPPPKFVRKRDF